ncbi:MAG: adenylosuccinate lyase [Furfurilactobacillus sp.]|jgi:adenylosuccinate lyase|uniref:Adenylosuccinate lyase n=1 Tax=Furfurilactobacillus milii TaxID=2888272 RepID=A0ABT6DEI5_9LACO|nr:MULTISPECIES: adenylosuccinate lyase [Furfurilactobacillus]QLE67625.1 Adenylosuccinate lyase [Furfurilactobacillus rossiae]MCF6160525.1 adenylosuccinate lyase [Furfurilactobacillus milii]MCF6162757.1 adenylosuccinate lyase [Furfurilactobacillus milii]MCF6418233.1 adenylosuccinate lyase [Furfurilactobacillus milii]MCH4011755.1 adenylosuccinate lyase [Furfurilactobacillus sp.]
MIDRYVRPEMGQIWSQKNKLQQWLKVEVAACQAWANLGKIPQADVDALCEHAVINVDRMQEIEAETHHDVVAFTRMLSESLGDERKWVHYGLTSTDVVDTAQALQLKAANALLMTDLQTLRDTLIKQAKRYRHTVMMGRTHGIQAEPMSFGVKLARWVDEINRDITRLQAVTDEMAVGELSGAVGTFANIPPQVEQDVCDQLGLRPQPVTSQVLPRDLHAHYLSVLALIATSLENFATEIRGLQRTEIGEVAEPFSVGQKGSSAMPHKHNPIGSENITGLARVIRGHMITAFEDVSLWHERDISHSSAERIILPDTTELLDYMLNRFNRIMTNLVVNEDRMIHNIESSGGLVFSQQLLLALIDKDISRETAYDHVQQLAQKAMTTDKTFQQLAMTSTFVNQYLTPAEVTAVFDVQRHLRYVDEIFKRVGIK